MTSTLHTQVMWGEKSWSDITQGVSWMTGSVISGFCKSLRVQHYTVVFFPSVSSNNHLKMHLRCPWTGSYCRCRGTVPLHAIKHLPEEWQGISSHSPAATPSQLTTTPPQTLPEMRWERQPQLPQIVQECFHLCHTRWARQIHLLPVRHVVWRCVGRC